MGQQVHEMLIKELFDLKPGTFIKGIKFLEISPLEGRSATLNLNGWQSDIKDKRYTDQYTVRTPWFNNPMFEPYDGNQSFVALNSLTPFVEDIDLEEGVGDSFQSMGWSHFDYNEPVGIHLGEFGVFGSWAMGGILIYTKILRGDGEIGYLACTTADINNKDLELL